MDPIRTQARMMQDYGAQQVLINYTLNWVVQSENPLPVGRHLASLTFNRGHVNMHFENCKVPVNGKAPPLSSCDTFQYACMVPSW